MSHNSTKKITRMSWYTILMPNTGIARVNKLSWNKQNQFIWIYPNGRTIRDIKTTAVGRYAAGSNKNQAPQDPPN